MDFEVSMCPDDCGSLSKMTESAKKVMGVSEIAAVADKGYYDGGDIEICEKSGTICYIPKVENGRPAPNSNYSHNKFKYDNANNWYVCPEGSILYARAPRKRKDGSFTPAYTNAAACHRCPQYRQCTNDRRGREIYRSLHQETLDAVDLRMQTNEGLKMIRKRKSIVEHPFGTTKHIWGYRQFLCRGVDKTTGEQSLVFLAYNFRRVFNIYKDNGKSLLEAIG